MTTTFPLLLAQVDEATRRALPERFQFTWPHEAADWVILGGLIVLAVMSIAVYIKDAAEVGAFWKAWLPFLRFSVIVALIVVFLDPHTRKSEEAISPSRVVLLVDTSASMDLKNRLPDEETGDEGGILSRTEAVRRVLADSDLVLKLRRNHEVLVYTFGDRLSERLATFPRLGEERYAALVDGNGDGNGEDGDAKSDDDAAKDGDGDESPGDKLADELADAAVQIDWQTALEPGGVETRLGDALRDLIREYASDTFAGVVVFSDGANNAGNDPDLARNIARKQNVRLVTVGVGSTRKLANLRITSVRMPSRAQVDDPYEITAFVRGDNVEGKRVRVELLGRPADDPNAPFETVGVDQGSRNPVDLELIADGREEEVTFTRTSTVAGEIEYKINIVPADGNLPELDEADNVHLQEMVVSKDPIRVLMIAGGPMREYRFVRDMMSRHKGIVTTLWLQSVDPKDVSKVSQDANNPLLTAFPERAELFGEIDVVIGFDPDWSLLTPEQRTTLAEWVGREAGGMILVAGDVSTQELVTGDATYQDILNLYPVALEAAGLNVHIDLGDGSDVEPWPPAFTPEGENVEFLQLSSDPLESATGWRDFEGIYKCYPTVGVKAGTVVYAHFSNPKARSAAGQHVLLAGQYYEAGRVLYLGSPEMWRLRGVDTDYYERFWTKALREVSQGRLNRSGNGSTLAPERERYFLGETVVVRSRLVDANFDAIDVESVELNVVDPTGKPILPRPRLRPEPGQPGVYRADFRAGIAGAGAPYTIAMTIPGTEESREAEVKVTVPNLELDEPEQNRVVLQNLAKGSDGTEYYTPVDEAAANVPTYLVDRTKPIIVDERRTKLWDKAWVMYLLVALLSLEWLSRKLLKLA